MSDERHASAACFALGQPAPAGTTPSSNWRWSGCDRCTLVP